MIMNLLRQAQHALGEQGGRMTRLDLIDVEQCSHDISDQADAMIDAIEAATEAPPPPPPEGGAMKARAVRQCRAVKAAKDKPDHKPEDKPEHDKPGHEKAGHGHEAHAHKR
jgi:hypothetical protein